MRALPSLYHLAIIQVSQCLATNKLPVKTELYSRVLRKQFNPFAPGDFAEKLILKLVEWFSGHCRAIKRQEKVKKRGGEKVKVKSAVSLLSPKTFAFCACPNFAS